MSSGAQELIQTITNQAVEQLNILLKNANKGGKKTLVLLAGGSNLDYLPDVSTDFLDSNFTLTTLDERYTTDPNKSNMAQIKAIHPFYDQAIEKGCRIIDTTIKDGENRDEMATRINQMLLNWLLENPDGEIIMTIGIGSDGHISGMKPMDKDMFTNLFDDNNPEKLVIGYDASSVDSDNPQRITTTMNFFRKIKDRAKIIVYAIGKSEALDKVSANTGDLNKTPARILREIERKNVNFCVDVVDFRL